MKFITIAVSDDDYTMLKRNALDYAKKIEGRDVILSKAIPLYLRRKIGVKVMLSQNTIDELKG